MLKHYYDGTLVSGSVALAGEKNISAKAQLGEVDIVQVIVDDPGGSLSFTSYKTWRMVEDAAPSGKQTIWYGFVLDKEISRGDSEIIFPVGTGRQWMLELHECNQFLSRRTLQDVDSPVRPAETVNARMTWLLTTTGMSGIIADHGLVESDTTLLDPGDYHDRTAADVLRDMILPIGFNFAVRYREASSDMELIFGSAERSQLDTSTFQISNAGDADEVTIWPPGHEAKLRQAGERIASGVSIPYPGGRWYDTNSATAAAFGAVDLVAPTGSVKTLAAAKVETTHLLSQHAEEDQRVLSVRLKVPAANINDFLVNQRILARFTHFPGWDPARYARVPVKSISRPDNLDQGSYDVDCELTPAIGVASIVQSVSGSVGIAGSFTLTQAKPVTAGHILVFAVSGRNKISPLTTTNLPTVGTILGRVVSWATLGSGVLIRPGDIAGPDRLQYFYAIAVGDEQTLVWTNNNLNITYYEIQGTTVAPSSWDTLSLSNQTAATTKSLGSFTSPLATDLQLGAFIWENGDSTSADETPIAGFTQDYEEASGSFHPGFLTMHSSTHPVVEIVGGSWNWAGAAVNAR